jgi:hypothetical protein
MQFRLRTLLLWLAILPPVLAGVWFLVTRLDLACVMSLVMFGVFAFVGIRLILIQLSRY